MSETKLVTYLHYSEIFKTFEKGGITFPIDILKSETDFETQIIYLLSNIDPTQLIQFSCFLNMICQTSITEVTIEKGAGLLYESNVLRKGERDLSHKVLFHRESLLNLITKVISQDRFGTQMLIGQSHVANQKKYSEALLLTNSITTIEEKEQDYKNGKFLRDYFIREWPHYYLPEVSTMIYKRRIRRYAYCYEALLLELEEHDKETIQKGITSFEEKEGVTLAEYMKVLHGLYIWFLEIPSTSDKIQLPDGQDKLGFDWRNPDSFYIRSELFEKDPSFMRIIDILSKDIQSLKTSILEEEEREYIIDGFNKNIRIFFDNPIFKMSDGLYCITDLKFLIENVCGGLLWRIKSKGELRSFKSSYGRLMEKYFQFLTENIFKGSKIQIGATSGADAVIIQDDVVFIIEFTTEYYRLPSIYNTSCEEFLKDAYLILFNEGRNDPLARVVKKEKGKLLKLNQYIENNQIEGKTIIPILVTENILGDDELFNNFNDFYNTHIVQKNLTHLQDNPPLFMCLDDMETLWSLFDPKDSGTALKEFAKDWISITKRAKFHSVSYGLSEYVFNKTKKDPIIKNKDFSNFFSNKSVFGKHID